MHPRSHPGADAEKSWEPRRCLMTCPEDHNGRYKDFEVFNVSTDVESLCFPRNEPKSKISPVLRWSAADDER